MREYTTEQLRNVAFVGHQSSGKTSLVEALLFNTGAINRLGKIEEKNTVSDWEDDAKERGLVVARHAQADRERARTARATRGHRHHLGSGEQLLMPCRDDVRTRCDSAENLDV